MYSIGQHLKRERELRHISLEELAQLTRIPMRTLLLLEAGDRDALPADVFVRGFVRSYARALGLDDVALLREYGAVKLEEPPPQPITSIPNDERGRRFGIAIAMMILLILFTLALSIVLRPRRRDTPIELSWNASCPAVQNEATLSSFAASTIETPIASLRS